MKYKVGDKFLIEIGEVYSNGLPFVDDNEPCTLYRIKGFKSLVFDENGLDKLEKLEEKKEKCVDWSNVAVDTPVFVSSSGNNWTRAYFAKYEDGHVYTFVAGKTSWSNAGFDAVPWKYAKLAESEEQHEVN